MTQRNEPTHKFRLGRIKVAIWANQTRQGEVWFNVEIVRAYQEGDQWKESSSFGRDDLPIVAKAAEMAYAWIWSPERSPSSAQSAD